MFIIVLLLRCALMRYFIDCFVFCLLVYLIVFGLLRVGSGW